MTAPPLHGPHPVPQPRLRPCARTAGTGEAVTRRAGTCAGPAGRVHRTSGA
ncbi:hypothetical protein [Streptomyces sp. MAI_2237]